METICEECKTPFESGRSSEIEDFEGSGLILCDQCLDEKDIY